MPPPKEQKFRLVSTVRLFHELRMTLESSWWSKHRQGHPHFTMQEPEFKDLMDQLQNMPGIKAMKVKPLSKRELLPDLEEFYTDVSEPVFVRGVGYMHTDPTQRHALMSEAVDEFAPHTELVLWFYGRPITNAVLRDLCWRLAAGQEWMKAGCRMRRELPSFSIPEHWAGVHIDAVHYGPPTQEKKYGSKMIPGKPQLSLDFRLLGGPFGGLAVTQNIPYSGVVYYLAKNIGFPVFKRTHYNELVQCVFIGKLTIEGSDRKFPRISEFFVSSAVRLYNAALRKDRAQPCLREFSHVCHRCPLGYFESDPCRNATRPVPVVKRQCQACGRESVFDPLSRSTKCLVCESAPFKLLEERGQ